MTAPEKERVSDIARRVDGLSLEKRARLERRLLERRRRAVDASIPRRAPGDPAPLSFSQQRLWFLDQWSPGTPAYNAALPMLIRGRLDVQMLLRALEMVVERHEVLRTVFRLDNAGEPHQEVLVDWVLELPVLDLEAVDPAERPEQLRRLLRDRARRPFDLERDLMLRATLIRLDEREHVLALEQHHIAFDGWSDAILFGEVATAYESLHCNREPELPALPVQYGDFALWQRRRLEEGGLDDQLEYWRRQLAGAPRHLRLPLDFSRPQVQGFEGAHHHFALPGPVAREALEISRRHGVTPFMTLLAVFAVLLYRLTGQDDVLVGSPIANRSKLELENLIGFFSNTLVLRVRLGGNPSFRDLLERVREVALGAYEHQDVPFEKVVELTRPVRDASANPLFQVNFRVQTGPTTGLELPGLEIEPLVVDVGFARFDLALELQLREDGLRGYWEYNRELFRPESVARFAATFDRLLADVLTRPDERILAFDVDTDTALAAPPAARLIKSFRNRTVGSAGHLHKQP